MSDGLLSQLRKAISTSDITLLDNSDLLRLLARSVRQAVDEGADPLPFAGVLVEGTVHLLKRLPSQRRQEAVVAVIQLLADRLTALSMN